MLDRLVSAAVAASLAFLVWLYARSRDQEILDNVPVPVHLTMAASQKGAFTFEATGPSQVPVTFTGSPARIRELRSRLQHGEFQVELTLTVPEDRQTESYVLDTVRVEASDIHAPPGVQPVVIEGRNRIPVTIHRLVERQLPVRFDHSWQDQVGQVTIEPATVLVKGPQELLDRARSVATVPYSLAPHLEKATPAQPVVIGPVPLVQELEGRPVQIRPSSVLVRVRVQPRQKVYDLDVPITFLCPVTFPARPRLYNKKDERITLKVFGPAAEEPPQVYAFVDLTTAKFESGRDDMPIRLQLPKGFTLEGDPPKGVAVELVPIDPLLKPPPAPALGTPSLGSP